MGGKKKEKRKLSMNWHFAWYLTLRVFLGRVVLPYFSPAGVHCFLDVPLVT